LVPDGHWKNHATPAIQITDIKLRLVEHGCDGLLAWASCIVSGGIKLDNIAIRRSRDGSLFLTYPAKRTANGDRYHYHHPITVEAANAVQNAVIARLAALARASAATAEEGARSS
jgi:DNA-binding cell septation regulator SpoVG